MGALLVVLLLALLLLEPAAGTDDQSQLVGVPSSDLSTSVAHPDEQPDYTTLSSRINRLERMVAHRQDLVEEYNVQVQGDRTIFDLVGKHIMKAIKSRPILPVTDAMCRWNFWRETCEPECKCSWQYKFGDLLPGRACRLNANKMAATGMSENKGLLVAQNNHEEKMPDDCDTHKRQRGPIRRFILAMKEKIAFVVKANKLLIGGGGEGKLV